MPFDVSEIDGLIRLLKQHLENYPYIDQFRSSPPPNHWREDKDRFDLINELDAIISEGYTNGLDFYNAILRVIRKAKDCHAYFTPPFMSDFYYALPFMFVPIFVEWNNYPVFRIDKSLLTEWYVDIENGENLTNNFVKEMDLSGDNKLIDSFLAISNWAAENELAGFSPHAQFNSAISYGFFYFSSRSYEYPKNTYIQLKIVDASNQNERIVEIPWVGVYMGLENITTFEELSPLLNVENMKKVSSSEKTKEEIYNELRKEIWVDVLKHQNNIFKKLSIKRNKYRSNDDQYLVKAFEDSDNGLVMYVKNFTNTKTDPQSTTTVGIFELTTFLPNNNNTGFLESCGKAFHELYYTHHASHVVIDVRGNGGGSVTVLEVLLDFLFGSVIYPTGLEMDYAKTELMDTVHPLLFDDNYIHEFGSEDKVVDYYTPSVKKNFTYLNGTKYERNYTERYFYDMKKDLKNVLVNEFSGGDLEYFPYDPQHMFILTDGVCFSCCGIFTKIVKDMKAAKVLGFGYHPGYSGQVENYETGSCPGILYTGNTYSSLHSNPAAEGRLDFDKIPMPFARQGMDLGFTLTEIFSRFPANPNEILFFEETHVDEVLNFTHFPIDKEREPQRLAEVLQRIFDDYINPERCVAGEVIPDMNNCSTEEAEAAHEIRGHPCDEDTHEFDKNKCEFARCAEGYYQYESSKCKVIPIRLEDTNQGERTEKKMSFFIYVCIFIFICLFA